MKNTTLEEGELLLMWDLNVCLWAGFAHLLMLFHMMEAFEPFMDSHF